MLCYFQHFWKQTQKHINVVSWQHLSLCLGACINVHAACEQLPDSGCIHVHAGVFVCICVHPSLWESKNIYMKMANSVKQEDLDKIIYIFF